MGQKRIVDVASCVTILRSSRHADLELLFPVGVAPRLRHKGNGRVEPLIQGRQSVSHRDCAVNSNMVLGKLRRKDSPTVSNLSTRRFYTAVHVGDDANLQLR